MACIYGSNNGINSMAKCTSLRLRGFLILSQICNQIVYGLRFLVVGRMGYYFLTCRLRQDKHHFSMTIFEFFSGFSLYILGVLSDQTKVLFYIDTQALFIILKNQNSKSQNGRFLFQAGCILLLAKRTDRTITGFHSFQKHIMMNKLLHAALFETRIQHSKRASKHIIFVI